MLLTKEFTFNAVHQIQFPNGKWEQPHEHRWELHVTLEGQLAKNGFVFDFIELDQIVRGKVIHLLDHQNLNNLFAQPTAEHVALWVWDRLKALPLKEVKVWEAEGCAVTYQGKK